jgi:hypothetical protein
LSRASISAARQCLRSRSFRAPRSGRRWPGTRAERFMSQARALQRAARPSSPTRTRGLFPNHHAHRAMWWSRGNGCGNRWNKPPQELRHGHDRLRRGRRAFLPLHNHGDPHRDTGHAEATHRGRAVGCRRRTHPRKHVQRRAWRGGSLGFGFIVRPPDFDCFVIEISRSVTLRLERSVVARGVVSADNGFTTCAASVPVKIQRRVPGEWKTVRTTTTSPTGSYKRRIPDKAGRYRATAPMIFRWPSRPALGTG